MNTISKYILITIPFFFLGLSVNAQVQRTFTMDSNSSLIMQEFKAILAEVDGDISVRMKLGSDEGDGDQLEAGDLIIMMNGKRFKTMAELKEIYEAIKKDEEVKIGVKRGEERFILRKVKGDVPEPAPGERGMVMNMSSEGAEAPTIIPELGLVISDEEDRVHVKSIVDMIAPDSIVKLELEGYEINSINGEVPKTAEDVKEIIGKIEIGKNIAFVFSKDGKELKPNIKKPATKGRVITRTID